MSPCPLNWQETSCEKQDPFLCALRQQLKGEYESPQHLRGLDASCTNLSSVPAFLGAFRGQTRRQICELIIYFPPEFPAGRGEGMAMKMMVTFPRRNVAPGTLSSRTRGTLRWEPSQANPLPFRAAFPQQLEYPVHFIRFYFLALCLRSWGLTWETEICKGQFGNQHFQWAWLSLAWIFLGRNFKSCFATPREIISCRVWFCCVGWAVTRAEGMVRVDVSLCSLCLTINSAFTYWGGYLWEKDKTHSRQALSDVEKMFW